MAERDAGVGDPCDGVACEAPPAPTCVSATTLRTSSAPGDCSGGTCSYPTADMECPAGCSGGTCVAPKVQRTVSAGKFFTCGVSKAGAVKCWGSNQRGELGNPEVVGVGKMVDIVGLSSDVVALSTSTGATCAITAAGAVECWGSSLYGELGAGTTESSDVPVEVVGF